MRSIAAAAPTATPACGPPSSLSAEKHTTSAPAATLSAAAGSPAVNSPSGPGIRDSTPEPRSSITSSPWLRASSASSLSAASSVKPTARKFEACTRIKAAVSGPIARS